LRFLDNPNLRNVKQFRKDMKLKHPTVKVKVGESKQPKATSPAEQQDDSTHVVETAA
jgi:hypothetical protein